MKAIEFKVTTCHKCPFCNNDNEFGRDGCNHPEANLDLKGFWYTLPDDKVHERCPLKKNNILVSL